MIYCVTDEPVGGDVDVDDVGDEGADADEVDVDDVGGEGADADEVGVDGGGVGLRVGELLCWGVGVGEGADAAALLRTGDVAGVLFAGPCAARLLATLLLVADGAGPLVAEPAPDLAVRRGFAPVRPTDWPGAGVLPALCIVGGEAAE